MQSDHLSSHAILFLLYPTLLANNSLHNANLKHTALLPGKQIQGTALWSSTIKYLSLAFIVARTILTVFYVLEYFCKWKGKIQSHYPMQIHSSGCSLEVLWTPQEALWPIARGGSHESYIVLLKTEITNCSFSKSLGLHCVKINNYFWAQRCSHSCSEQQALHRQALWRDSWAWLRTQVFTKNTGQLAR